MMPVVEYLYKFEDLTAAFFAGVIKGGTSGSHEYIYVDPETVFSPWCFLVLRI